MTVVVPALRPVTAPVVAFTEMIAMPRVLHAPPVAPLARVMVAPLQTLSGPVIDKETPVDTTPTSFIAVSDPQSGVVAIYNIVSAPTARPVSVIVVPEVTEEAISGCVLTHDPPGNDAVRLIDEPEHTPPGPEIAPALGRAFTVTVWCALSEPQLSDDTVYNMVVLPGVRPVITPPLTVALAGAVLIQVPPVKVSASVITAPTHTSVAPVMVPVSPTGSTRMM